MAVRSIILFPSSTFSMFYQIFLNFAPTLLHLKCAAATAAGNVCMCLILTPFQAVAIKVSEINIFCP